MSTTDRELLTVTDTAKLLRRALRAAHPSVKFSVRSNTYSGGASIDVSWTDGPTASTVDRTAEMYCGATFDGMTDSMNYHSTLLAGPDGGVQNVRFGADFVFTHRTESDDLIAAQRADIEARGREAMLSNWYGPCSGCISYVQPDADCWNTLGAGGACSIDCAARVNARHTST